MTRRRGRGHKHQPNPPRREHQPGLKLYRIKTPKVYSSYPYSSYDAVEVGTFATDLDRNVLACPFDAFPRLKTEELEFPIDLNDGLEEYYERKEVDSNRLTNSLPLWQRFLKWIQNSDFDLSSVDFIARRGILKYIGHTLYDFHKSPWSFRVCKYDGKIYMYEAKPEQRAKSAVEKDESCKKYLYWGHKFEDVVTQAQESERCGYYRMVRGNIGKYKVLLGAEVDAVRVKEKNDDVVIEQVLRGCPDCSLLKRCRYTSSDSLAEYIEIKTCVKRQLRNKTSFGWLQSYLAGVETLVFGFRDSAGLVDEVKELKVKEVPHTADWSANAMFGLISGVLNWVQQHVEEGESADMFFEGGSKLEIALKNKGEEHFLPEWYTKHLASKVE